MRFSFSTLLFLFTLLPSPLLLAANNYQLLNDAERFSEFTQQQALYVAVSGANLRSEPSTSAKVVHSLLLGTPLTLMEPAGGTVKLGSRYNKWYKVRTEPYLGQEAFEGYLFGSTITPLRLETDLNSDGSKEIITVSLRSNQRASVLMYDSAKPETLNKPIAYYSVHSTPRVSAKLSHLELASKPSIQLSIEGQSYHLLYINSHLAKVNGDIAFIQPESLMDDVYVEEDFETGDAYEIDSYSIRNVQRVGYMIAGAQQGRELIRMYADYGCKGRCDGEAVYFIRDGNSLSFVETRALPQLDNIVDVRHLGYRLNKPKASIKLHALQAPKKINIKGQDLSYSTHLIDVPREKLELLAKSSAGHLYALAPVASAKQFEQRLYMGKHNWLEKAQLWYDHKSQLFLLHDDGSASAYAYEPDVVPATQNQAEGYDGSAYKKNLGCDLDYLAFNAEYVGDDLQSFVSQKKTYGQPKGSTAYMEKLYSHYKKLNVFNDGNEALPYPDFLVKGPMLLAEDDFGRYIASFNTELFPQCMAEPIIYLYPQRAQDIKLKVNKVNMAATEPKYKDAWQLRATEQGKLTVDGKSYPYLFWEGTSYVFPKPVSGFVVAKEALEVFFKEKLSLLGLNPVEQADFLEAWLPELSQKPFYHIYFHTLQAIEHYAPLEVEPKPDSQIRVLFSYSPLEQKRVIPEQVLETPAQRKGFTLVEWGGFRQ